LAHWTGGIMISVVGFYTVDTPYEDEAKAWISSIIESCPPNMGVKLYPVSSRGSWEKNCALKPEIILQACDDLKCPFLYVDIDARFKKYPELFDLDWSHYNIGVHYFRNRELLSGTIWVNPVPETINLLQAWKNACMDSPNIWDQRTLSKTLLMHGNVNILKLPPEYTFIYDLSLTYYGSNISPVILHTQASRKYKRSIGG
jgi:hypothetical protein